MLNPIQTAATPAKMSSSEAPSAAAEFQQALRRTGLQTVTQMDSPDHRAPLGVLLRHLDIGMRGILKDAQNARNTTEQMSLEEAHIWGMETMVRHTHARVQFDILASSISGVRNGLQQLLKGS